MKRAITIKFIYTFLFLLLLTGCDSIFNFYTYKCICCKSKCRFGNALADTLISFKIDNVDFIITDTSKILTYRLYVENLSDYEIYLSEAELLFFHAFKINDQTIYNSIYEINRRSENTVNWNIRPINYHGDWGPTSTDTLKKKGKLQYKIIFNDYYYNRFFNTFDIKDQFNLTYLFEGYLHIENCYYRFDEMGKCVPKFYINSNFDVYSLPDDPRAILKPLSSNTVLWIHKIDSTNTLKNQSIQK
ncbi:MAG: hypothetical protein WCT77_10315 [Bacteroidota bacterium]